MKQCTYISINKRERLSVWKILNCACAVRISIIKDGCLFVGVCVQKISFSLSFVWPNGQEDKQPSGCLDSRNWYILKIIHYFCFFRFMYQGGALEKQPDQPGTSAKKKN